MRLEVHNVGYGECIVICQNGGILMSDCGSSNTKLPCGLNFTDYVRTCIMPRYIGFEHRAFLLTHCHRDHSCGLWHMLKLSPRYFDRIFLPAVSCDVSGRPVLLEFALYVFAFLNRLTGYSKSNTEVLKIFSKAAHAAGPECVFPVKQGDSFSLESITYDVLWPKVSGFPYENGFVSAVSAMDGFLSQPFMPDAAREFLQLKREFCLAYMACQSSSPVRMECIDELDEITREISRLVPNLLLLPCAPEITGLLSESQNVYSDTLNSSCIVFQNRRVNGECSDNDILMTGDATPDVLQSIENLLYDGYYIVKAPHHGTKSGFPQFLNDMAPSHIIISNGLYGGGGKISDEYSALQSVKHCTNCSSCCFYHENNYCCNDFAICYDMKKSPGLTVKCPYRKSENPPCGISVISG